MKYINKLTKYMTYITIEHQLLINQMNENSFIDQNQFESVYSKINKLNKYLNEYGKITDRIRSEIQTEQNNLKDQRVKDLQELSDQLQDKLNVLETQSSSLSQISHIMTNPSDFNSLQPEDEENTV